MSSCANITFETLPDFCIEVPGEVCLQVTVLDGAGGGSLTLDQFKVLMAQYNSFLAAQPRYASEEEAAIGGVVSGQEFLWSSDTDVGIPGDKHIMS